MFQSGIYNNRESIKSILLENGYPVREGNNYFSTSALYRGGTDSSSVVIYYNDNKVVDFVTSQKYTLDDFIKLITNQSSDEKIAEYIKAKNVILKPSGIDDIKQPKTFDSSILNDFVQIYDYFTNRGIDENVLKELKSGLYTGDIKFLKNRIVFPCFNSKGQINLLAGRDVTGTNKTYWILRGQKTECVYPAFVNQKDIREKNSVILVEGISDLLSLFSCGIRNVLVMFGTELNLSILNFLLKINIDNIYIASNNDLLRTDKSSDAGNEASLKIYKKLCKYFNKEQVSILLPEKYKDWNEVHKNLGKEEILRQFKNIL